MSLDLVKEIFSALPDCREWHAHLLNFTHSKRHGTTYNCRRIELEPTERLMWKHCFKELQIPTQNRIHLA